MRADPLGADPLGAIVGAGPTGLYERAWQRIVLQVACLDGVGSFSIVILDVLKMGGTEMLPNHYEIELMMMERVKDALREAEQARLIRAVEGSRESQGRRLVMVIHRSLQKVAAPAFALGRRRADRPSQSAFSGTACSTPGSHRAECY